MRLVTALALAGVFGLAACSAAASPAASPAPTDLTAGELALLSGVRLDLQGGCAARRTGLPEAALAGVECTAADEMVERVALSLFDTQQDLLHTYLAQLAAHGVQPRTNGDCAIGHGWEGAYIPGDSGAGLSPERAGCYMDVNGMAHYVATLPPFVLVEIDGEAEAVQRFAWLGNSDTPGGPTIWNSGGPMSPEK